MVCLSGERIAVLFYMSLLVGTSTAQRTDPCNVCRSPDRFITDPDTPVEVRDLLQNLVASTCGELEQVAQTIASGNSVCGIFTSHADASCQCGGPPIPPPHVIDTTPVCDLCAGRPVSFVPESRRDELVQTNLFGEMPCGFLFDASADGFLPATFCLPLQQNVGAFCCSIPFLSCTPGVDCPVVPTPSPTPAPAPGTNPEPSEVPSEIPSETPSRSLTKAPAAGATPDPTSEPSQTPTPAPTPAPVPTCGGVLSPCSDAASCCGDLICRVRFIGEDPLCSTPSVRGKTKLRVGPTTRSASTVNQGGRAGNRGGRRK